MGQKMRRTHTVTDPTMLVSDIYANRPDLNVNLG